MMKKRKKKEKESMIQMKSGIPWRSFYANSRIAFTMHYVKIWKCACSCQGHECNSSTQMNKLNFSLFLFSQICLSVPYLTNRYYVAVKRNEN